MCSSDLPTVLSNRAWLRLAGPVPEIIAPAGGVVLLLLFGVAAGLRTRSRIAVPCSRCANAAEVRLGAPETAPLCEQCNNLFIRNIPVDRRIRFEKEERIARFRLVRRWGLRASSLALPGLPSLLQGHPLRGGLAVVLVALLALRIALPHGLLLEPYDGAPLDALWTSIAAGGLGLLWLGSIVFTARATRGID